VRVAAGVIACLAAMAGSAVVVASGVDTAAAQQRARAAQVLRDTQNGVDGCGCTADVRAKDRLAGRATAEGDADQ
jgi:hypothetical protein